MSDHSWEDDEEDYTSDGMDVQEPSKLDSAEELASRVRRLVELRAEKDETDAAAKRAKKEFEQYQEYFYEELSKSPLKGSVKVDLGGDHGTVQITPMETYYGRVLDKDKALEYFNDRALTEEFLKTEISKARVNELVREHIEQKKPLPAGLDFYPKRYFRVTFK